MLQGIIYEEPSVWLFLLVTCVLGGAAAWITGRSMALGWQSVPRLVAAVLGLGIAVRFIHHALFHGTMFSLRYYIVDTIVLLVIGFVGYRFTRTNQMTTQYSWLFEKTGPFSWRPRPETVKNESG
jgi:hypothetical protein